MQQSNVRLVGITYPKLEGINSAEELVAYVARVSNPSNQLNKETSAGLIARQILRHRSFSFQEFSQRYADPTKDLSFVTREARYQDPKNRQNSVKVDELDDHDRQVQYQWENLQSNLIERVEDVYQWAIAKGIAKEQARAVLPEGLMQSRMYMNGTLRSWIHYVQLRSANGTQLEHQEIAKLCGKVLQQEFPNIVAFVDEAT